MPRQFSLIALKSLYGRWLGELAWIESPPKTMGRTSRNRDKFTEEAALRAERAEEIKRGLPQIAYVIQLFDPDWRPEMEKVVRPSAKNEKGPPQGWTAAALDVLRDANQAFTIAEIVEQICEKYELELSTVAVRQKRHTAINNSLRRTYDSLIESDAGEPARWGFRSKGFFE